MVDFSISSNAIRGALRYLRADPDRADPLSPGQLEGALERERDHTIHFDMHPNMHPDSAQKTQSTTQVIYDKTVSDW